LILKGAGIVFKRSRVCSRAIGDVRKNIRS